MPQSERPNPLGAVASKVGVAWSAVAGIVTALVSLGVLTAAQGAALSVAAQQSETLLITLGSVIAGVLALAAGLLASFRTVSAARDEVTPITDPRTADGTPLIPAPAPAFPTIAPRQNSAPETDPFGYPFDDADQPDSGAPAQT